MVDPGLAGLGLGGLFTSHTLHTVGLAAGCFLPDFQPDFQAWKTFLVATSGNRQQRGLQREWEERLKE